MGPAKLFLFGQPRLERVGQPVDLSLRKAMALLAYLAMTGQSQSRDALAALLWPEDSQSRARGNLRRALSRVNTALGQGQLRADREQAGLNPTAELWLDVAHFEHCLAACQAHHHPPDEPCDRCLHLLAEAAATYTDDFMAGFSLRDCPAFDEWQFFAREGLRQGLSTVLERLVQGHALRGEPTAALAYARRRLALDPLHEPAQRQVMELYARTGQPAAAIRQYHECVRLLREELGAAPSPETARLYEAIRGRTDRVADPHGQRMSLSANIPDALAIGPVQPSPARPTLPRQATSFVGRETELAALAARLADPACRLLTLVGSGGIGKTRLALQVAERHGAAFADGAVFVPLAALDPARLGVSTNALAGALVDTLHLVVHDSRPEAQLLTWLHGKELLLVLDSFEHLLHIEDTVALVSTILHHAPGVKLLVTSRERLHVQNEWLLPIQGMAHPTVVLPNAATAATQEVDDDSPGGQGRDWMQYDAVRLFAARARQIQPDFDLAAEGPAVVRICQLVDGVPLALELAAGWVRTLPCRTIAQEIEQGSALLVATLHDLPERHRSVRAVFDHSWRLLSEPEQAVFARLAVFAGGFGRAAGEAVAGASLPLLSSLVDKSLLQRTPSGRYTVHTLLRQYAAEQLQRDAAAQAHTVQTHAEYYAAFLHQHDRDLVGSRQAEAWAALAADLDNIRSAWQWAIDNRAPEILEQAQNALGFFYEQRSHFGEGEAAFGRAVAMVRDLKMDDPTRQAALLGVLLGTQGWFAARIGLPAGKAQLEESIAWLRRGGPAARWDLAMNLTLLGNRLFFEDYAQAEVLLHEALVLAQAVGDAYLLAYTTLTLGQAAEYRGDYRAALPYLQEGMARFAAAGDLRSRAFALNSLGRTAYAMGDCALAKDLLTQAYQARQAFDDPLGLAFSLLGLGVLARLQGALDEARRHIQASLAHFEEIGGRAMTPLCYLALGEVARLEHGDAEAEQLFQRSLALSREMGLTSQLPASLNMLGHLAYRRGDLAVAEAYLQESLVSCRQVADVGEMAWAMRHLGYVAAAKGNAYRRDAQAYFRQALATVAQTGAAPLALDVLLGWATLLAAGDASGEARRQAVELATLVQQHAASTYETREEAQRLLDRMVRGLSPEEVAPAQTRGQAGDLWRTVAGLTESVA